MKIEDLKVGTTVWVLDRQRVRSGKGPTPATVAAIVNGLFRTAGTRGMYAPREAYATEPQALLAWSELADAELARERSRFNKIATRLSAPALRSAA